MAEMVLPEISVEVLSDSESNKKKVQICLTVDSNQGLISKSDMGKVKQKCKVCNASGAFQTWQAYEMFDGTGDRFVYFECPECITLQIETIPDNIGDYYLGSYYSYKPPAVKPVRPGAQQDTRMILDVGCGAGIWLCFLAEIGCVHLYGCDPFIEKDIKYSNGVQIRKCTIHEMEGVFDVIALKSSFEHMPDPHDVFKTLQRLLSKKADPYGGKPKIEMEIPIYPNLVFDIYKAYWHNMDPPRHFFLFSKKSISMLAEQYGFTIENIQYNEGSAFGLSYYRQFDIPYTKAAEIIPKNDAYMRFNRAQEPYFNLLGNCANLTQQSDYATITLVRK